MILCPSERMSENYTIYDNCVLIEKRINNKRILYCLHFIHEMHVNDVIQQGFYGRYN